MELQLRSRDLELDQAVHDHILREVNRMRRRLPGIGLARVELSRVNTCNQNYRVLGCVSLHVDGTVTSGAMRGADPMQAVNLAFDEISRQWAPWEAYPEGD